MASSPVFWLFLLATQSVFGGRKEDALIRNLPNITFQHNFKQYSGFLNASPKKFLHYWLVESQNDPETDPLILWFNGGPGCSSIIGLLTELGPFRVNRDGHSLYENKFSWNKFANVMFLEFPTGVGWSYSSDWKDATDDDLTALDNYNALKDLFRNVFPEYWSRDLFIAGESYAGVYIPTLAKLLIEDKNFPAKLKGVAIGNGILSEKHQHNSIVDFMYFHGVIGDSIWKKLKTKCCKSEADPTKCDFYSNLVRNFNFWFSDNTECGNLTFKVSEQIMWHSLNNEYNIYEDCYKDVKKTAMGFKQSLRHFSAFSDTAANSHRLISKLSCFLKRRINYDSTDAVDGALCWGDAAMDKYMNNPDVQQAIHIPEKLLAAKEWKDCNSTFELHIYNRTYFDLSSFFEAMMKAEPPIRILVYNGDVDTVCNFLGDEWFVTEITDRLKTPVVKEREPWVYRGQTGGYVKRYRNLDLLTIKGAGHFVPISRAGPTLQMIYNFVKGHPYSNSTGLDLSLKPLLNFSPAVPTCFFLILSFLMIHVAAF